MINDNDKIEYIKNSINDFGGEIKFRNSIRCKITPHSKESKIYELNKNTDLNKFDSFMIQTIYQRIKLINAYKNKHHDSELEKFIIRN